MKLARLYLPDEAREVLALSHDDSFYRVDLLDRAMGAPLPDDLEAVTFGRRALALGPWTLEEHQAAIVGGASLADTVASEFQVLPPARDGAKVLEARDQGPAWAWRVSPSLYGSGDAVMSARPLAGLAATPGVGVVLGEDLRAARPDEVLSSILGITLALAWTSLDDEEVAVRSGLPSTVAREIGTHLGPALTVMPPTSLTLAVSAGGPAREVTLRVDGDRIAEALARVSQHDELRAGDVLVCLADVRVEAAFGRPVVVDAGSFGRLLGMVGV